MKYEPLLSLIYGKTGAFAFYEADRGESEDSELSKATAKPKRRGRWRFAKKQLFEIHRPKVYITDGMSCIVHASKKTEKTDVWIDKKGCDNYGKDGIWRH